MSWVQLFHLHIPGSTISLSVNILMSPNSLRVYWTPAHQSHGTHILGMSRKRQLSEGVVFSRTSPRKRGNLNQLAQAFLARFPHNKKLCPVETFRHYLKKTRSVRPTVPCSKPVPLLNRKYWVLAPPYHSRCWYQYGHFQGPLCSFSFNYCGCQWQCWSCSSTFQMFYYKPVFNWKILPNCTQLIIAMS